MNHRRPTPHCLPLLLATAFLPLVAPAQPIGVPPRALPESPFVIDSAEQGPIRVSAMQGLALPWDMAFLPNGDILVTERSAMQIRLVRDFVLDPQPIAGIPEMGAAGGGGLMSIVIHPRFADSLLNACFVSDASRLLRADRVSLWIHGHTHDSFDHLVNGTRVVCNPRGYARGGVNENPAFDASFIVEV